MENEFGEHISEEELAAITERIRKLAPNQIDAIFHSCGFIFADHVKEFKALRKSDIDSIMGDIETAKKTIWDLINESRIEEVKSALDAQEKQ